MMVGYVFGIFQSYPVRRKLLISPGM